MDKLTQLRASYGEKLKAAKDFNAALEANCKKENRDPTDDERTKFDGLLAEIDQLKVGIEAGEADRAREARLGVAQDFQRTAPARLTTPSQPTDTPDRVPTIPAQARRRRDTLKAFAAADDPERQTYAFGSFVAATLGGNMRADQWCRDNGIYATMSSTSNAAGGYAIPDVFIPDMIRLVELRGVFRQFAAVKPMASDTAIWPRRTGGQTAYFTAEGANPTESDITGDNVSLVAKEIAVMTVVPRNLMEDAMIDLGELVAIESAHAMATLEDTVGFNGAGTAAHGGIHGATVKINDGNHDAGIYEALAGNTAFSTLDLVDFEGLVGALPIFPGQNQMWFISKPGFYASMARLLDAAGGNTKSDLAGGTGLQFLGYPVVLSNTLNATLGADASAIKLLFGDLAQACMMGNRRAYSIASDGGGKYFQAGTIAIKATARFDVNVHSLGDGTNAGPLMAMKTPAS